MARSHRRVRPLETYPHADISINRNRIRKHSGTTMYLENGTEFEIELDNNTQETWLAKIKFNDKAISQSGIVLRPGEHTFIERFLDENKKFLFDTYEVHKSRKKAISNNGKIEIQFFRERKFSDMSWGHQTWITRPKHIPRNPIPFPLPFEPTITNPFDYFTTGKYTGSTTIGQIRSNLLNELSGGGTSKEIGSVQCSFGDSNQPQMLSANFIETGRIEKGSESKQEFTTVDIDFDSFCSHRLDYQILPLSQKKFIENKEIRQYCTDCGRRRKKSENFCPIDGAKY